ncbi:MAG: L,D-transpeptidase, partial [Candidatus Marinimicrobia bacterium]|nr:L,D-transpeptidase [Candidatus Neomarinimicrobiota bacterium]
MFKKAILVIFMSFNIFAENNLTIEIDISKQR